MSSKLELKIVSKIYEISKKKDFKFDLINNFDLSISIIINSYNLSKYMNLLHNHLIINNTVLDSSSSDEIDINLQIKTQKRSKNGVQKHRMV